MPENPQSLITNFQQNSLNMIITLGYDKNGNVSGVINRQAFSTETNTLRSSSSGLKSSTANSVKYGCAPAYNNGNRMRILSPQSVR